jgi:hypothetical protein
MQDYLRQNYFNDPVGFAQNILKVKNVYEKPHRQTLESLAQWKPTLMRCGHGVGKSFTMALAILWFFYTRPFCRIPIFGPSWAQLKNFLWSEIDKLWLRLPPEFAAIAHKTEVQNFYMRDYRRQWAAFSFAPANSDLVEGLHAGFILQVFEEAKAIEKEIVDAAQGAITSKYCLPFGGSTPGDAEGFFYEANTSQRHLWNIIHVSQYDSPLVDPESIKDKEQRWGRTSPLFQTKVLGEYPAEGINKIVPLAAVEAAMGYKDKVEGRKALGVDVARFGDHQTAFVLLQGFQVLRHETYGGRDTMYTCGRIMDYVQKENIEVVGIDDRGVGGGVTDRFREIKPHTVDIVPVTGSELPDDSVNYENWQTEILFTIAEKLKAGELRLGEAEEVRSQLTTIPYTISSHGRLLMPRDFHLPDLASALTQGIWALIAGQRASLSAMSDMNASGFIGGRRSSFD